MYPIENRHQDSGWEPSGRSGRTYAEACILAQEMSREQMVWGMTRVLHPNGGVGSVYTAGRCISEASMDPRASYGTMGDAPPPPLRETLEQAARRARTYFTR